MNDRSKLFKADALHECLACSDNPTAQKQINLLIGMLHLNFDENVEKTLDAMLLDLNDYVSASEDEEDDTFFLAALWLSTLADMGQLDPDIERSLLVSGRTVVRGGAASVGAPLTATLREVAQPSMGDFVFWYKRLLSTDPSIKNDFITAVKRFLSEERTMAAKIALIANIRQILLRARRSVLLALDLWAYRWLGIGAFEGLVALHGPLVTIVAFNNPPTGPDKRTTPFCSWVHGRVIEVRRARMQIQAYLSAISAGDADAALEAWPLLKEGEDYEVAFSNMSLPPYHFRCRTVPRAQT